MAQGDNDNQINVSFCKILMDILFERLYKMEIFTTNVIEPSIRHNTKSNNQLTEDERTKLFESLEEVSAIDKNFIHLKTDYVIHSIHSGFNLNMGDFKEYVKSANSGYYYLKDKFLLFIKALLMIPQIIIILRLLYPKHICIEEAINEGDKKFWGFDDKFYKVIDIENYGEIILRALIFIIDVIFLIYEFYILKNLERIKANVCLIITLQLTKLICLVIITSDLTTNYRESSLDDKNKFRFKDNIFETIMNVYEFSKFFR